MGACTTEPPREIRGADGVLAGDDLRCLIYPADGFADVQIGPDYVLSIELPASPDAWGRRGASLAYGTTIGCQYPLGFSAVRVQFGGALVRAPDCHRCATRYRALYVEGLDFPGGEACDCHGDCRTFEPSAAERFYLYCESPDEAGR